MSSSMRMVSVTLDCNSELASLAIEDNGPGFSADDSHAQRRLERQALGLAGMRERLRSIGGSLNVQSSVGAGTTIIARIRHSEVRAS